jgi:hypothetical protein
MCSDFKIVLENLIKGALLNGIALWPRQTDSINQIIPLTEVHFA